VGSLAMIDAAIDHTPTLLDLHMFKGRIFKHAGALKEAAEQMETARKMDLADRYLNTKATRYLLRANALDDATKTIALFTKDGENSSNLFDMQCMWYELEVAHCHLRQGDFGRALKNFSSVEKHFADIVEDQFDFHTYCIRKMTLRAYVRLLRLEDHLYGHTFFVRAACGIIESYLRISDKKENKAAAAAAAEEAKAAKQAKASAKRPLESTVKPSKEPRRAPLPAGAIIQLANKGMMSAKVGEYDIVCKRYTLYVEAKPGDGKGFVKLLPGSYEAGAFRQPLGKGKINDKA